MDSKTWLMIGGGGVAAAVLAWYWYENYGPGAAAAATSTSSITDQNSTASSTDTTDTGDTYSSQPGGEATDAQDYAVPAPQFRAYARRPAPRRRQPSAIELARLRAQTGVTRGRGVTSATKPASTNCPVKHPQTFAQWLNVQTWAKGQPRTVQMTEYRSYVARWRSGMWGGIQPGCPGYVPYNG